MKAVVLIIMLFVVPQVPCELELGWKGIRVFDTDRVSVRRVLGREPAEGGEVESRFVTDEAIVRVVYSSGRCKAVDKLTGSYDLEPGVVIQYDVVPRNDLSLTKLGHNPSLYSRWEDDHAFGFVHYYNKRDGIRISTSMVGPKRTEYVRHIYFERTPEMEAKFACRKKKTVISN